MSWPKGFDFRQTSTYVTDPTNCTYVLDTDTYPVTRNGVTFGWTVAPSGGRDRSNSIDARLAGINFGNANGTFRVDLTSSGTYAISLAMGDAGASQTQMTFTIKDNATTVLSYGPFDTSSGGSPVNAQFYDATSTVYTATTWPGSETPVNQAFSSSTLYLLLGAATSNSTIAHLFLSQQAAAGGWGPLLGFQRDRLVRPN